MKNKKGFTLIELLAVIVILGLLMAIAIPSVTKYITQSRKKTIVSTIGNYITAMVNEVNDLTYTFTEENTIFAVPIECISLERGGTNPFGAWHQANDAYWAYVLVQYDDETSSYRYGYTFKDSAGYGLYPITQAKLNEQGKQIQTGLSLNKPTSGKVTNITALANWNGFAVNADTNLQVLEAESEGTPGDGKNTCTLAQKGDNYATIEKEKEESKYKLLTDLIKTNNPLITKTPTLTTSSYESGDASGLYSSTATNKNNPTYYFRGNVENNYVEFAGLVWRIIRINEDGTIRLILNDVASETGVKFNTAYTSYSNMYYSNSDTIKKAVENWYTNNITNKGLDSYVATSIFCEQAKVKSGSGVTTGSANSLIYNTEYTPNFRCTKDGNGKGVLELKVGLITYDEVIHAGSYIFKTNKDVYLGSNDISEWTMSPCGMLYEQASMWYDFSGSTTVIGRTDTVYPYRPVINLNANVMAYGDGTSTKMYKIKTN